jgi:hypothetical protein
MNNNLLNSLSTVSSGIGYTIFAALPSLLGGLLVFVLGIILGNFAQKAVVRALQAIHFEDLVKDTKFRSFMQRAELTEKVEVMLGTAVKWLILTIFFIAATNIWGLTTVSTLLLGIFGYLPNILSAVIVLAIGVLLAGIVESMVKAGLASIDLRTARLMGKIASYLVVTIAILAAFSELRIARDFINILFIGFVAMLSLGFGLAIGLGAKDLVSKLLGNWYTEVSTELKKHK